MLHKNGSSQVSPITVGIVGAGFSGTALVAAIHRAAKYPIDIHLFDKTGLFAAGQAYKTTYPFHLLNARARDMSAFEEMPMHFCEWLEQQKTALPYIDKDLSIAEQFLPRLLYHQYLRSILDAICADAKGNVTVTLHANEVVDLREIDDKTVLVTNDGQRISVDKVVLAIGVEPPGRFPFPVANDMQRIANPWQYESVANIPADDPVLIVGTGLSMVDATLTLHHQKHRGKVIAVSRHRLLPLSHANLRHIQPLETEKLPTNLRALFRKMRMLSQEVVTAGGDWRSIFNMLRAKMPDLWRLSKLADKKRFLRHVLPYWNVQRHRLHDKICELLNHLQQTGWLTLYAGRVIEIESGSATVKLRHSGKQVCFPVKWVINCMGFSLHDGVAQQPLLASLLKQGKASFDVLRLGFDATAEGMLKTDKDINPVYTIGPPMQGESWETVGVPEIRKQCARLAQKILMPEKKYLKEEL